MESNPFPAELLIRICHVWRYGYRFGHIILTRAYFRRMSNFIKSSENSDSAYFRGMFYFRKKIRYIKSLLFKFSVRVLDCLCNFISIRTMF